jgi:hypothetical protein
MERYYVDTPSPEERAAYLKREEARFLRTFDPSKYANQSTNSLDNTTPLTTLQP